MLKDLECWTVKKVRPSRWYYLYTLKRISENVKLLKLKCLRSPSDLKDEQEAEVCNKFSLLLGFWDITKFIYLYEWDKTVSQYDLWNNSKVRNESPFFSIESVLHYGHRVHLE